MLSERLCSRIPSAKAIGRALLEDWVVVFSKRSKDGTGKANLVEKSGAVTWGVLYEIDVQDLEVLDRVEGGYKRLTVRVRKSGGDEVEATTYISENLTDDPTAHRWYKDTILSGAHEHSLPQSYIAYLEELPVKSNSNSENGRLTHKD
jgi:gamma-glutamylcyclotransferase (GGCT)/AIG2-like uncharacterized protein YtfP